MDCNFKTILNNHQLQTLASIIQVGDAAYWEMVNIQQPVLEHRYFTDIRGRLRTKLVQLQCEIESKEPGFPFEFIQRELAYRQIVPELHTKDLILHIGRSSSPDKLPCESEYKRQMSERNHLVRRQMVIDTALYPPYGEIPFYGLLVFGGEKEVFSVIQFPEPGYKGIAESIDVPKMDMEYTNKEVKTLERKKAKLKEEFANRNPKEKIS